MEAGSVPVVAPASPAAVKLPEWMTEALLAGSLEVFKRVGRVHQGRLKRDMAMHRGQVLKVIAELDRRGLLAGMERARPVWARGGKRGEPKTGRIPGRSDVKGVGMLKVMRHVIKNPKETDRDELERRTRKWLDSDLKGFMLKMTNLESEERAGKGVEDVDAGEARMEMLLKQLLSELK